MKEKEFNESEWYTMESIRQRFRKKDNTLGVSRVYMKGILDSGKLPLKSITLDGQTFYYVSLEDQKKENWGLNEVFEEAKRLRNDESNDDE